MDDHTVKITLNKQDSTFLASLGMDFISIYSAEYADKLLKEGKPETLDTTPIGQVHSYSLATSLINVFVS